MKDFIFDSLPTLNSNPAKNGFLAACSSTSADMPRACESFMKITRQFQNNFPQPAAAFGVFSRKLSQITRKLAFSLPHHRLSSVDASITLRSAQARSFENYSCPSASVRSENKFSIKFSDNLRELAFSLPHRRLSNADASITLPSAQARFTFREATPSEDGLSEMFCCQTENARSHRLRPWLLSASELARKRQGRRLSAAKPSNCRIIVLQKPSV